MGNAPRQHRRQWRDYRTVGGARPVKKFFDSLTDEEAAEVAAAMKEVAGEGLPAARHLRGDIYEVRAEAGSRTFRILFSAEGHYRHILLSLSGLVKKTRKTPQPETRLAEDDCVTGEPGANPALRAKQSVDAKPLQLHNSQHGQDERLPRRNRC